MWKIYLKAKNAESKWPVKTAWLQSFILKSPTPVKCYLSKCLQMNDSVIQQRLKLETQYKPEKDYKIEMSLSSLLFDRPKFIHGSFQMCLLYFCEIGF